MGSGLPFTHWLNMGIGGRSPPLLEAFGSAASLRPALFAFMSGNRGEESIENVLFIFQRTARIRVCAMRLDAIP